MIDLYFLILAVIAQILIPTAEITIPRETLTNEGNAEIETQLLTAETIIKKILKVIENPAHLL